VAALFAIAYVSTYLMLRERHLEYRPFYLAITYGEDRLVVRCINRKFLEDNAVLQMMGHLRTDYGRYPEARYWIETNGLFVVMDRKDTLGWRRVFRPLEFMELKQMRFFPNQAPEGAAR